MSQNFWHIHNCSLFERLTIDQLSTLESRARKRLFSRGTTIYLPRDSAESIFLLASGRVRLGESTADGKYALLGFIEAGELFGELSLLSPDSREEMAEAMVDSTVMVLPSSLIIQMMDTSAPLAIGVTKLIGLRRLRIERRLKSLLFRSNRQRLIFLILELVEKYGRSSGAGVLLDVKLAHQDFANLIGATRETVTTTLGELQKQKFLKIERQKITLLDLPRLAREIDQAAPSLPVR